MEITRPCKGLFGSYCGFSDLKELAMMRRCSSGLLVVLVVVMLTACGSSDESNPSVGFDSYDIDANGIPRFVDTDYIDLGSIDQISMFRSAVGHDYSDDDESCRSMKHYYKPFSTLDWDLIRIYSPVHGTISRMDQEWAGTQVHIKSEEYPAFTFILFHVALSGPFSVGDPVDAGQQLGTHIGDQTMSDIAIRVRTPIGSIKLVSYFDVMTDGLFQDYIGRGLASRDDVIISKDDRDADPLDCDGEVFLDTGTLPDWVSLID